MSIRTWINNHSSIVTIITVLVLLVAIGVVIWDAGGVGGGRPGTPAYYYDLNTGEIFVRSTPELAPIEAPSGPHQGESAGVLAVVYACGQCPADLEGMTAKELEQTNAYIGWLQRYTDKIKKARASGGSDQDSRMPPPVSSQRLMPVGGETWVSGTSGQATTLQQNELQRCGDQEPQECTP
jgi:hypothetical protein